jgi:hypothetical protein
MSTHAARQSESALPSLIKRDPSAAALIARGRADVAVKAGTIFGGVTFAEDTPVVFDVDLEAGNDYAVIVKDGSLGYVRLASAAIGDDILGGFHFAPGGNAGARDGGDSEPAINPRSLWDRNFRPACPDPRGMALIETPSGKFWCDIYLTGVDHLADGTSRFGATIADGDDPPAKPGRGHFAKFDYETALAVMKLHGKGLLSFAEFAAAAFGVREKTACHDNPRTTALDAPRTSRCGLIQATGNMWTWGHDGDPDEPRASIFGGSWLGGGNAGSRCASVAYYWPRYSGGNLGARGRGDHLQLG